MFRKYYKEANDSIKPSEDFVNSVIRDAKKHKPPLRACYTQYAAVAAAAVIVVTGAVTALPLLQKAQRDGGEGIVIEERAMDSGSTATPSQNAVPTTVPMPAAAANEKSGDAQNSVQSSIQKPERADAPSHNTSESSYSVSGNVSRNTEQPPEAEQSGEYNNEHKEDIQEAVPEPAPEPKENGETEATDETTDAPTEADNGENSGAAGGGSSASYILGESDEIVRQENIAPEDMTPYSEKRDLSDISAADTEAIDDADIPCPDGYYCIEASPNGYTFKNGDGAVISVTINYGGADREPYITEEDGSIYAVFTSFGLSVTINAYGADMATVEEIINQFR